MSNQVPVVLTNAAQSFTDTQKAQGRANIDAASAADLQTESIVDSFAGSFAYPVNGKNLYKQSGASWNVGGTFNLTDCAEKSTAEMKSQAFCDLLNSNASASSYPATWSYSEGMFPYLYNWRN